MLAKVFISLKPGVLDPQGKAAQHSLATMGFKEVESVRIGKMIEVKVNETSKKDAEARIKDMCEKLLANTVIENYRIEIEG